MAGPSSGHDDGTEFRFEMSRKSVGPKIFFIIFVDAIFTTLFERLFTNVFDVTGANASNFLRVSRPATPINSLAT